MVRKQDESLKTSLKRKETKVTRAWIGSWFHSFHAPKKPSHIQSASGEWYLPGSKGTIVWKVDIWLNTWLSGNGNRWVFPGTTANRSLNFFTNTVARKGMGSSVFFAWMAGEYSKDWFTKLRTMSQQVRNTFSARRFLAKDFSRTPATPKDVEKSGNYDEDFWVVWWKKS